MLNTTNIKMGSNTSNVTFNSPSTGMMQRSNPKYFFVRFAKGSPMEEHIFNENGDQAAIKTREQKWKPWETVFEVEVLQVLVFGNVEFLCELVKTSDLTDISDQNK